MRGRAGPQKVIPLHMLIPLKRRGVTPSNSPMICPFCREMELGEGRGFSKHDGC